MKAEVSTTNRLVKAVAVMGSGTLISRVLGLIRLALIIAILGSATRQADMFWFANLLPNTLLLFLAGGVLNTVLVPQIVRAIKNDDDGGEAYVNRILTAFGLGIGGVTALLTLAVPVLLWIYVSDAWRAPAVAEHYAGMVLLTYLCVPQLFFYGVFFLLGQVLNAKDEFAPMNWAPIANNLVSIAVFALYFAVWGLGDTSAPFTTGQILLLGIGSTVGIVVQLLVLLPFMKRTGFRFKARFDLRGTGLGRTASLAKWTIYYVAVSQLMLIVVQRLASSATAGGAGAGMTVYSSAEMLWLLPHSLITVSLATAMLSSASRLASEHDLAGVASEAMKTIKFAVLLLVPASVGLIALAYPATRLLFGHGSGASGAAYIGTTLIAFSIGLVPYTIQFICNRVYYALEDTRGAFILQAIIVALNAVFAAALVLPFDAPQWTAPALGLAVSLSYLIGVYLTVRALKQKLPTLPAGEIVRLVVRLFTVAIPGGVAAYFAATATANALGGFVGDLVGSLAGVAAFLPLFVGGAKLLHIRELDEALRLLRRRGRPSVVATPDAEPIVQPPGDGVVLDVADELIDTIERPAISTLNDDTMAPIVESGQLLNRRYSLQDRLLRRGDTETWLAFDQVLSRLVLVHVLPTAYSRMTEVLDAARKGAVATESRFLRVLDAVEAHEPNLPVGGYVVCEYAPGQNLEELLASGPLSATEAAWIVREVADAMTTMHAQGLFHERLSPDTVLVTASGNVKIVGFGVESALTPSSDPNPSWSRREASDVRALGKLLYAALVHRWPGGDAWGMRGAPRDANGGYLTPRQVRQGVSPALDGICDQILSETPRRGEAPLRTASEIVRALNRVLGTADASSDLEHRLRYPTVHDQQRPGTAAPVADAVTQHIPVVMVATDEADFPPEPLTIKPPALAARPPLPAPRRRWLIALVSIVGATLVVSLAAIALQNASRATSDPPTSNPTPNASPSAYKIVSGSDFDPNGDQTENPKQVGYAFDGDPKTGWTTERYRKSPKLGDLKPGVGIVLDLGEAKQVQAVKVTLTGKPTSFEVRMPAGDSPGTKITDWTPVATASDAGTEVELSLTAPVTTRYLLVWLTSLPEVTAGRYEAKINEITVLG